MKIYYKRGRALIVGSWKITNDGIPYVDEMKNNASIQKMIEIGTLGLIQTNEDCPQEPQVLEPVKSSSVESTVTPVIAQPPVETETYIQETQPSVVVVTAQSEKPVEVPIENQEPVAPETPEESNVAPTEAAVEPESPGEVAPAVEEAPVETSKKKNRGRPRRNHNTRPNGPSV